MKHVPGCALANTMHTARAVIETTRAVVHESTCMIYHTSGAESADRACGFPVNVRIATSRCHRVIAFRKVVCSVDDWPSQPATPPACGLRKETTTALLVLVLVLVLLLDACPIYIARLLPRTSDNGDESCGSLSLGLEFLSLNNDNAVMRGTVR